jgi:hypothetical protein
MRYEYIISNPAGFGYAILGALGGIKEERNPESAITPNSNALRLAVAPQRPAAPSAYFPKSGTRHQITAPPPFFG